MKYAYLIPLAALVFAANSHAQARIFRCGNAYTNDAAEAKSKNCKLVEGGYITVVEGTRVQGAPSGSASNASTKLASAGTRVESADQKARDSDARQILESELKKAEVRQAELLKEFNNGEPDKQGSEGRNYQKYLDRVAELKASIARNQNDIAGIKRELDRVPASK
ncbi:hypothetical protein ACFPOE_16475 [Caenimonas terrae]|uniref:Uncharacterized protein n=1 Tax=Caenimonas terrae TaxID=696074 RepID=A0ABW0NHI7_9BURK